MPKTKRPPTYRLHKARHCAVVAINGRNVYLGPFGSPESHERYARLVVEWQAQNGQPQPGSATAAGAAAPLSVNELILRYWRHALQHYRKEGALTGYHHSVQHTPDYMALSGRGPN